MAFTVLSTPSARCSARWPRSRSSALRTTRSTASSVVSFAAALVGLLVIVLLVEPDRRERSERRLTRQDAVALVRLPRFRALTLAGTALAVTTISDAFVYVDSSTHSISTSATCRCSTSQRRASSCCSRCRSARWPTGSDAAGSLSGATSCCWPSTAFFSSPQGTLTVVLLAPLFGAYYAATDGVLAAASTAVL